MLLLLPFANSPTDDAGGSSVEEKNKANDVNLCRRLMNEHHLLGQSHSFSSRERSKVTIDNSKSKNVRDKR